LSTCFFELLGGASSELCICPGIDGEDDAEDADAEKDV
jgi:hypothetical protein